MNSQPPSAENDLAFQALARGDRNGVLKLRGIPTFQDMQAKRQWIRQHLAASFRFFGKQGWGEGVSGHISVRGMESIVKLVISFQGSNNRRPDPTRPFLVQPIRHALFPYQGIRPGPR